jgi:hypothetical protein
MQCTHDNRKPEQFLFECILESALFYALSFSKPKRHVKQLLGTLLIRISEISSTVGTEVAQKATRQLIALGSHIPDHDDSALCGLWSVAQRVAQEEPIVPGRKVQNPSPSSPASSRPAFSAPPILSLCSPVLVFVNGLLETIASKAGQEAVKHSLNALGYLEDLTGDASGCTRRLYLYAMVSNNVRIISSLLHFASDADINVTFPAFGEYRRVTAWAGVTAIKSYRRVRDEKDTLPRFFYQYEPEDLTSLHFAVLSGQLDLLETLLAYPGIDVDKHASGHTPLSYAAYVGNPSAVALLLNAGADVDGDLTVQYGNKHTPLQHAVVSGEVAIAEMLIRSGAKVNAAGRYYKTALHIAEDAAMAKLLLDAGADPSCGDEMNRTPYWNLSNI